MKFIFLSTIDWGWSGGAHTPTQLASALARQGHSVMFVQSGPPDSKPRHDSIQVVGLDELGWNDLQVGRALHGLDGGSVNPIADQITSRIEKGFAPRVAVWFAPFDPFVRLLPVLSSLGCATMYLPLDDYESMAEMGFAQFNLAAERYLVQHVDLVVALSPAGDRLRSFGQRVEILPQMASVQAFGKPAGKTQVDSRVLRGDCTLGFWGAMNAPMFDAEAVAYVARERPRWALNLIGDYDKEPRWHSVHERLADLHNVRFHGFVPPEELPAFAEGFDVCLIPAPPSAFTQNRDPIKLYQYLAAHKPVVSTNMPHLAGAPFVRNASTLNEFMDAIEHAAHASIDVRLIDEFLAAHAPDTVAKQFVGLAESLNAGRVNSRISPRAAPAETFANKNAPVEAYLSVLEKDLLTVRAWALDLESQARLKESELRRIQNFLPIRLVRSLSPRKR